MLSRISAIVFIAVCATATVLPRGGGERSYHSLACVVDVVVDQMKQSSDPAIASLAGLLGIVLPNLNIPVGLACSPLNVLGIGGTNW
ncbi:hypothetical protein H0H93_001220 [Arthromyces matolae]|nr:hypothetical protein H0H93_001220 [Arthromyces matolae]